MKTVYAILLLSLVGFVATDMSRVAALWSDYRAKDVVEHSIFAVGAVLISGANAYLMLFRTPTRARGHTVLLLSFVSQVILVAIFALFAVAAWKGYLFEIGSSTALWSNSETVGVLLLLLLLLAGLLFWSAKQSTPSPTLHHASGRGR